MKYGHLDPQKVQEQLSAPFPASAVEWRPGKVSQKDGRPPAALAMAYIDARAVQERLDSVVGVDRWQSDHAGIGDKQIACRIGILFETGWVWKSDGTYSGNLESSGAVDSKEEGRLEMEGKGSFSVAMKRAAVSWGIGRYLYDIDSVWADVEKRGNSWAFSRSGLAKLDSIADKLYRAANQGRGGRMPAYEPDDDERPPSDRPSAEAPRSGARAAADRAVEAQIRGPVAQVPTHDPAHLALCDDFARRARIADIGEGREEPADIHDLILKSDLPKPLRDQALVAVYRRASEIVDDPDVLDGWIRAALSAALDEGQKATLRECFAAADERISKLPPIDAAA